MTNGGTGVGGGEGFTPLGTRNFTPLIERILVSGADVVLSSFAGAYLAGFERQCTCRECGSSAARSPRPR